MQLKHLITFQQVAYTLSFNQAAENLNYAQPTVSAHIKALENELGVVLFNRMGKGILLTGAGENLLVYAEEMIRLSNKALSEIGKSEGKGVETVRIGASESILAFILPDIVQNYQMLYPESRLVINPVLFPDLVDAVRSDKIDLAFAYREDVADDMDSEVIINEKIQLAVAADHPLAHGHSIFDRDLDGQLLIAPGPDCPYGNMLESRLKKQGVKMKKDYSFHTLQPIIQFAKQEGIALMVRRALQPEIESGQLVPLILQEGELEIPLRAIWRKGHNLSPATIALVDLVNKFFQNQDR